MKTLRIEEIVVRKNTEKNIFEAFFNATNDIAIGDNPESAIENLKKKYNRGENAKITRLNHPVEGR